MKELRRKTFKNGVVYCLQLEDGFLVETTDTILPYYTKDAIGRHQNKLDNNFLEDQEAKKNKLRWLKKQPLKKLMLPKLKLLWQR